jgi:hypothetical protein
MSRLAMRNTVNTWRQRSMRPAMARTSPVTAMTVVSVLIS